MRRMLRFHETREIECVWAMSGALKNLRHNSRRSGCNHNQTDHGTLAKSTSLKFSLSMPHLFRQEAG
jgi:hypothetical protein